MSDTPTVTQQYSFAVGEDGDTDGIEPSEESVETDLEAFGADVDHREQDTRIDQPEATSFGVDDRKTVTRGDGGEQRALFADTKDDQQTLTGERAASQCLFESDDTPDDEQGDDRTEEPDTASDEPTESSPRAVATDGGQPVEDDEPTDTEWGNERCEWCQSLNNVSNGFVHDVADESWTDHDALCRECFIEAAAGHDAEAETKTDHDNDREPMTDGGHVEDPGDEPDTDDHSERSDDGREDDRAEDDRADEPTESPDEGEDTTFDADAETVTEAWEGAFITASWGYEQTNVELAQIVEVSGSGKTVLARFVTAERVGHGRTSEQLRPTADQYGDEFRLHVRDGINSDPRFRGSYPLSNDGDMDGPTRRGSFYPWDNDPDNSIRQTATNHGH